MAERTSRNDRAEVPCPACQMTLDDASYEKAHLCQKCLALHHATCWSGSCAACGARPEVVALAPEKKVKPRKRTSRAPWQSIKRATAIA